MASPSATIDLTRALAIDGWMSPRELHWLAETASRAHTIIEVGCYHGRSTRALADHCPGVVFAVDPYPGPYYFDHGGLMREFDDRDLAIFRDHLRDHLATGKVVHLRSTLAHPILVFEADLIFIDGDHRVEAVREDIRHALRRLAPNGILAGHDYDDPAWPGVKHAVDEAFNRVATVDHIWYTLHPYA